MAIAPVSQMGSANFSSASVPDRERRVLQLLGWHTTQLDSLSMQSYHPTARCKHGSLSVV